MKGVSVEFLLSIVGAAVSILLVIISFFIQALIKKLEEGNNTLIKLDKSVAIFHVQQDENTKKIDRIEEDVDSIKESFIVIDHDVQRLKKSEALH